MAYFRGYRLSELAAFDGWADAATPAATDLNAEDIVYLRDDLIVVRTPVLADPQVIWADVTPRWREFCELVLRFAVPADLRRPQEAVGA